MSSLINRVQRALLGSAGPAKVKALLAELAIPAGGSGGTIREVRRGVLRPISDEAVLRDALAAIGVTGGGGNPHQGVSNIRNAVLHNVINPETKLLAGLDDLLEPGDLAGGGGPEWVPADAKIHIDFLGGEPQGRAWVDGMGEVAVGDLIGNDPNADNAYDTTFPYDSGFMTPNGYSIRSALLGAAREAMAAGSTMAIKIFRHPSVTLSQTLFASDVAAENSLTIIISGDDGTVDVTVGAGITVNYVSNGTGAVDGVALTLVENRVDVAANGSTAGTIAMATLALGVFVLDTAPSWLQSITIYDPLPDTTGLSELSES